MVSEARTIPRSGRGEGESNHPGNASIANAASRNSPQAFFHFVNATKLQKKMFLKRTPCRSRGRNTFSGCFDLRLSRLRRDSRAAQHDKFETFFEEIDFPELCKIKLTHYPLRPRQGLVNAMCRMEWTTASKSSRCLDIL